MSTGAAKRPSTQASLGYGDSWGPYWDAMFRPALVTAWIDWKRCSTGVNVARALWRQREYLRRVYLEVHGDDPDGWPSRHPGVVLDDVSSSGYAACLGCPWLDGRERSPLLAAQRHETSGGDAD